MSEALAVALHELRRPLQVAMLALAGRPRPASAIACLEQAAAALEQLEHVLGLRSSADPARPARVAGADLLADARLRWQGLDAEDCGAQTVAVAGAEPGVEVRGDRRALGAALDNLIANALEHGPGGARVELRTDPAGVALSVANGLAAKAAEPRAARGHGLAVAARTAAELGGRLEPPHLEEGRIVSALSLPPADGPPSHHAPGR